LLPGLEEETGEFFERVRYVPIQVYSHSLMY
jgi:hypothetical protein